MIYRSHDGTIHAYHFDWNRGVYLTGCGLYIAPNTNEKHQEVSCSICREQATENSDQQPIIKEQG